MQLSEFTKMKNYTSKKTTNKQVPIYMHYRIEVTENGAHGDTEMIPVVPSLSKEVRLHWRGVVATMANQRHKGLTLFSGDPRLKGLGHGSTKGIPQGGKQAYTRFLGAHFHN